MTKRVKPVQSFSLAALAALSLVAGCTSVPNSQIPFAGNNAQPAVNLNQEVLAQGLSPRVQEMVATARREMNSDRFLSRYQAGQSSFSTLNVGDFGIKCDCPLDDKMYAIGGNGLGLDRIYEYNTSTHAMTEIAKTEVSTNESISSAAIAKHPLTGEIYFLDSFTAPRRLYRLNPTTKVRTLVGATNLASDLVSLAFSRSGQLYTFSEDKKLYQLNLNTAAASQIPLTGATGNSSGDIAVYVDDDIIYRVDSNRALYKFDLSAGTSSLIGTISGIPTDYTPAGLGFNPAGELLVMSWTFNTNNFTGTSSLHKVDISKSTPTATLVKSYSGGTYPHTNAAYPLWDLTSAHRYTCPNVSVGKPTTPKMLMNDSFQGRPANFANLPGENNPDTVSGWRQWNADYYPAGKGVVAFNPGRYNPAPGGIDDPKNDILGKRSTPGEFESERPHLLETSIAKTIPLNYSNGDRLLAKLNVAPTFTHGDSDTTLMLCFDDPANTVAVSSTLRGTKTGSSELYVETEIPSCATKVTVIALGYLGQNEDSSVTFEKASLEYLPQNYYSKTALLTEPFDTATTHATYGADFPANFDDQFGIYDLYLVNNFPVKAGDKALTAGLPTTLDGSFGGLVKRVNLGTVTNKTSLIAKLYTATRFTSAASEASLLMEFYNASNVKLSTVNAQPVRGDQYRWIQIDRAAIPTGATYVKLVPIFKLGAGETASFLWNDLSLEKVTSP